MHRTLPFCLTLFTAFSLNHVVHAVDTEKTEPTDTASTDAVSFKRDVWPIFRRHCRGCHSRADAKGGLSMDSVADMLKGGEGGPSLIASKVAESRLLDMITGDQPEMPKQQPALSAAKVEIIRKWILAGAKDDSDPGDLTPKVRIPETYKFAPAVTSVSISPDGTRIAAACRSEIVLFPVEGDAPPQRIPTECDLLTHVEFSPDGSKLAAVGGSPSSFGEVRFYEAASGTLISSRRVGHDTLFRGSFSPDGTSVAVGGTDGAAHIVPLNSKSNVRSFPLHSDWVFDVDWTPDGKMLITAGRDKATKVCSVETGKLLRSVDMSTERVQAVSSSATFAFSSGLARTLTGYEFKIALSGIEVSGAGNGARPITRRAQYVKGMETQAGPVLTMATSLDRKLLAIGGAYRDIRVYKTDDRTRVALIPNLPATVYAVSLNKDGTRLVSGGRDGQVQIYELPSGKLLRSLVPVPVASAAGVAAK
ncbi:MAG: c-type cytochrome domain-containing protein [Planctomycetales bacterium]|jgi:WD40 repeat protein